VKKRLSEITTIYEVSNYRKIPNLIRNICEENTDKEIILIEIGGYSATISKYLKNVVLAVEDTNQGYWRFKQQEPSPSYQPTTHQINCENQVSSTRLLICEATGLLCATRVMSQEYEVRFSTFL